MKKNNTTQNVIHNPHEKHIQKGVITDINIPNTILANFSLLVLPHKEQVSGIVEIIKSKKNIKLNVVGTITSNNKNSNINDIHIYGMYFKNTSTNNTSYTTEKFSATLTLDQNWKGIGSFFYENKKIKNILVKSRIG